MPQEIIFTTLPHQRTKVNGEDMLKLSVFVSVKLSTPNDTTLSEFEDIMAWPQKVLNAGFRFRLQNGTLLDAQLLAEQLDPDLYHVIFHKDIKVDDFKEEENLSARRIYSFPMKHVQDFILQTYTQEAVINPTQKVTPEKFVDELNLGAISRIKLNPQTIQQVSQPRRTSALKAQNLMMKQVDSDRQLRATIQQNKFKRFERQMDPKNDFTQLRQFHRVDRQAGPKLQIQLKKPSFEFHDILSAITSFPQIMRKLGFVLDFIVPYNASIPAKGTIQLVPEGLVFDEEGTTVSIPATAYEITNSGFYIGDKTDSIFKQGFVKINTDNFAVVQVDADGTALKTSNMAENKVQEIARFYEVRANLSVSSMLKAKEMEEVEPPKDEGLPFMRSAGIAITKNGMAEHVFTRVQNNIQIKQSFVSASPQIMQVQPKMLIQGVVPQIYQLKVKEPVKVLYSNDVIQGYQMDIAYDDDPNKWYSLHQRQDEYSWFDEQNNPHKIEGIHPDEGCIQLGMAEDPENPEDVFVSETLARWEGWSLSVRKPGYAINESDDYELQEGETQKKDFVYKSKTQEAQKYAFDPDLDFRINAQSKIVAGTLPKLRFGKNYRVRIRAVDLAGNSVPLLSQPEAPGETIRYNIRYMRYEPLASPIVLVGNELKDGEFLESMVIRSNYDQSVGEYENSHPVDGEKLDDHSLRYLLPPKNSQQIAETHGMFEKAFSNPDMAKEIYQIITSHEGLYQQDEKNKEKIYKPSEVEIIYLPDPMAAGVALFLAEDCETTHTQEFTPRMFSFFSNDELAPNQTNSVDKPEDWYHAKHLRLRLEEGPTDAQWNAGQRQLTIYLPKGLRTRIKFSTFWREKDLKQLSAIWEMVKKASSGNQSELEKLAFSGRHWMVSPSREMELVHALQQPLEEPVIQNLLPNRDFSDTTVDINIRFKIHGESTEKVELQSRWTEPHDDGISVKIKERQGSNSIPDVLVNYQDEIITKGTIPAPEVLVRPQVQNLQIAPIKKFEMRTKADFERDPQPGAVRLNSLYKTQAVSYQKFEVEKQAAPKTIVNQVKFDVQEYKFSFVKQVMFRIKALEQQFSDTKHRWVDYRLVAASRYREYFDKILTANPALTTTRESVWMERVNIPSTARPKVPEIDYIIPTFEWRKTQTADAVRHQRVGGGLRIFLKRPWYSTGDDEMLAVILPDRAINTGMLAMRAPGYSDYYTNWGIDPILYSVQPAGFSPADQDFRMNPVIDDDLQYPDRNAKAKAVAYPVHFDEDRQSWFCDLSINPGNMYFPFVKLALARYQPYSVRKNDEDVCLSPVVMGHFIQLMPDRQTTIRFKRDDVNSKFTITVEGPIYNDRLAKYGNYNFLRISFQDSRIAQPIFGTVSDGTNDKDLNEEGVEIPINARVIENNRFSISREFNLPRKYKTEAFQIVVEEYERGPNKIGGLPPNYQNRLEQSEETDRLIYADVFNINAQEK
ncbi:hypothetical protein [Gaoshiqia sp. Z1-71]|uniref:hypothetical protein n=1 Tax=Gaoshiqia hydrogeniformans TaxID=3290090 RepID=UPI003BF8CBA7